MPKPTPFLTIVSGLPRSGTSMMMRMIEAGGIPALVDNIRVADEDNPRGYYEFEPVKQTKKDASWLAGSEGQVVKMVYRLLYDLPADRQYRIVFTQRKLEEVVASQNVMLERQGKPGGDLSQDKLLSLFEAELDKSYSWLAEQPNFRVLFVDYNETLADPAPTVHAVNEFLGGNLDVNAMLKVVEPQLYRQRK
ncbi:MAG: sulfotransferase family protein [Planctomycetota bacterium]